MELNYIISTLISTNNLRYLVLILSPKKQITIASLYSYLNQSISNAQALKTAEILKLKKKYRSLSNEKKAQVHFCSVLMHFQNQRFNFS